jgi:hypothetical protein
MGVLGVVDAACHNALAEARLLKLMDSFRLVINTILRYFLTVSIFDTSILMPSGKHAGQIEKSIAGLPDQLCAAGASTQRS